MRRKLQLPDSDRVWVVLGLILFTLPILGSWLWDEGRWMLALSVVGVLLLFLALAERTGVIPNQDAARTAAADEAKMRPRERLGRYLRRQFVRNI